MEERRPSDATLPDAKEEEGVTLLSPPAPTAQPLAAAPPLPAAAAAPAPVSFQRWILLLASLAALLFFYVAHSSSYVPLDDGGRAVDKSAHHAAPPRPSARPAPPAGADSGGSAAAAAPPALQQAGLPQKPSSPVLLPGVEVVCDLVDGAWARAASLPLQWEPVHGDAIAEAFAAGGSAAGLRALLRHASWRALLGGDAARRQYAHLEGMRAAERRAPAAARQQAQAQAGQQQYPPLSFLQDTSPAAYAWPFSQVLPLPSMLTVGVPGATLAAAAAAPGSSAAAAPASVRDIFLAALARGASRGSSGSSGSEGDGEGGATAPLHAVFNFSRAGGAHAFDSLLHDPHAPARLLPRLAPYLQFTLSASSTAHMTRAELELVHGAMVRTCASLVGAVGSAAREALAEGLGAQRDAGCDVGGSAVGPAEAFHGAQGMLEEWKRVQSEIRVEAGEKWVSQDAPGSATRGGGGGLRGVRAAAAGDGADASAGGAELEEEEEASTDSSFLHHPLVLLEEIRLHIAQGDLPGSSSSSGGGGSFPHALPYLGAPESYALTLEGTEIPGFLGPGGTGGSSSDAGGGSGDALGGAAAAAGSSGALAEVLSATPWGAVQGLEGIAQVLESWEVQAQHGRGLASSLTALRQVLSTHIPEKCSTSASSSGAGEGQGSASPQREEEEGAGDGVRGSAGGGGAPQAQPKGQGQRNRKPQPLALPRAATPPISLPLYVLDSPWKPWRGQLLDTARHFMPVADVLALLDGMAAARLNVLHWHICDAQSFPLLLPSLPELAAKGAWHAEAVYSPSDVRAVVVHAAARGIRVVPEVDMPAHTRALGRAYPTLLAPCGTASAGNDLKQMDKAALDPTQEATYELLGKVLKDVAALFPDAYFHLGADEVVAECWEGNADIQAWAVEHLGALLPQRAGKPMPSDVHAALLAYFLSRVGALLEGVGKKPVTWEDSFVVVDGAARSRGTQRELKVEAWDKAGGTKGQPQQAAAASAQPPLPAAASSLPSEKKVKQQPSKSATRTPARAAPSHSSSTPSSTGGGGSDDIDTDDAAQKDYNGAAASVATGSDSSTHSSTRTPSRSRSNTRTPSRSSARTPTATGTPAAALSIAQADDDTQASAGEDDFVPPSASAKPAAPPPSAKSPSRRPATRSHSASVTPPLPLSPLSDSGEGAAEEEGVVEEPSEDDMAQSLSRTPTRTPTRTPRGPVAAPLASAAAPAAALAAGATHTRTPSHLPSTEDVEAPPAASPSASSTPTPSSSPSRTPTPSSTRSASRTPSRTLKPPASPAPYMPQSLALAYPPSAIIQGWKCWESHAEGALAAATAARHAVLQSSCWYLDWSSTWADFAQHWPLPEGSTSALLPPPSAAPAGHIMPYPPKVFSQASAHLGGEAAMWSERVDGSNVACRVWPRAAVTAEVGWSHSLAYARIATPEARPALPPGALAAVGIRLLSHARRMARRGLHAATLAIFSPAAGAGAGAGAAPALSLAPPAMKMEEDFLAFNGMCPGIAQGVQRTPQALSTLRGLSMPTGAGAGRGLKFVSWNVHDGAQTLDRQGALLSWLKTTDAHVVGVVEAMGWQSALPGAWVATLENRQRRLSGSGAAEGEEEEEEEVQLVGPSRMRTAARALAPVGNGSSSPSPLPPPSPAPQGRGSGAQGTTPTSPQSAGFQRRAALAGYPYSHLLLTTSGFHLALLSALPLTVVLEDPGTGAFERGLLVGDAGGVRYVVVHLHAQDAGARLEEAARIRALVAAYSAAGLAVVVMGDFNTLSPADAACLEAEEAAAGLLAPGAPPHLRTKYTCVPAASPGCLESFVHATGGASGANSNPATPLLDYRPMQLLLSSSDDPGVALSDLYSSGSSGSGSGAGGGRAAACPASYPTAFLASRAGVAVDGHDDNAHVPLRVDYALGNAALLAAHPGLACTLGGLHFSADGHVLDAVTRRRLSPAAAAEAFGAMLKASDHLPVVCAAP